MSRRYYNLPSLNALATFETVARHSSIKRAAVELGVTSGAVSRQIKALEEYLDIELFTRDGHSFDLTEPAEELYAVIANGFSRVSEVVARVRNSHSDQRVTIASPVNTGPLWLMPVMLDFWQQHPDIHIDHVVCLDERDYHKAEVNLRIRYGIGAWPNDMAIHLLDVQYFPVCSPEFAKQYAAASAEDLPHLPLLHAEVTSEWTCWDEFFRLAGIVHGNLNGRRMSNYSMALQACQAGQGILMGWSHLIVELLRNGSLVPFTDLTVKAPYSFYITWDQHRDLSAAALLVKDYLIEYQHQ